MSVWSAVKIRWSIFAQHWKGETLISFVMLCMISILVEIRKGQPLDAIAITTMIKNEVKPTETTGKPKTEVFLKKVFFFASM